MMMYHQTEFGCQKISSSADMVETVIFDCMSPHCDPKNEDSKPIFLHDTLAHDDASSNQVWLQKDLECSYSFFSEDTLAYDDVSSDPVWLLKNQQFRRYTRKSRILMI